MLFCSKESQLNFTSRLVTDIYISTYAALCFSSTLITRLTITLLRLFALPVTIHRRF